MTTPQGPFQSPDPSGAFGGGRHRPGPVGGFAAPAASPLTATQPPATPAAGRGRKRKDKPAKAAKVATRSTSKILALAGACAAGAALVGLSLISSGGPSTYVVRVADDVPASATLRPEHLEAIELDGAAIQDGAFTADSSEAAVAEALEVAADRPVVYPLAEGTQLLPSHFSTEGVTVGSPLAANERRVSISATPAAANAGLIRPGDRVDVVAVATAVGDTIAGVVATDIEVLAVAVGADSGPNDDEGEGAEDNEALLTTGVPATYLLRVDAGQVTDLAVADTAATRLYVVYRGAGADDSAARTASLLDALCGRGAGGPGPSNLTACAAAP